MNKKKKEVDMLLYHDPGDENDNKDISKDAEMIPKELAEKINERNKLRNEIEEDEDAEQE
tara:strand:+ start:1213 stop:1392 length:180 start_codon:yes stop_codon:yes gene_type:complete